jgi:hypothetical protein
LRRCRHVTCGTPVRIACRINYTARTNCITSGLPDHCRVQLVRIGLCIYCS